MKRWRMVIHTVHGYPSTRYVFLPLPPERKTRCICAEWMDGRGSTSSGSMLHLSCCEDDDWYSTEQRKRSSESSCHETALNSWIWNFGKERPTMGTITLFLGDPNLDKGARQKHLAMSITWPVKKKKSGIHNYTKSSSQHKELFTL